MRVAASLTAAALALTGTLAAVQYATPGAAHADEITVSQNAQRDDWDPNEPQLSPSAVSGSRFGQIFATKVVGQVYAQPLVVGNSVLVATEANWVYSLNATTGAVQWSTHLGSPWSESVTGCRDLEPQIGTTGTPVYDPATNTLYLVAITANGNTTTTSPAVKFFAVNETTGHVNWFTQISGHPTNDSSEAFNSEFERERVGLLELNGSVYMGFASYCDKQPYVGYISGVNTTTHAFTLWSDESSGPISTSNSEAGVWQSGGGLVSDGTHIFFSTGNGNRPNAGPGNTPSRTLGNSVVRLSVNADGSLTATDFFAPGNADQLNLNDRDFGSGGPVALPFGTSTDPNLIVTAGKDARIFLLNEASLGGRSKVDVTPPPGKNCTANSNALFCGFATSSTTVHGMWGHMAAFAGAGGADYVYYPGGGSGGDFTQVLKFNGSHPTAPVLTNAGRTPVLFPFSSGSPYITSNGNSASSAVLWEVYALNSSGANGRLYAFTAVPGSGGVLRQLFSAPIGLASKFTVPATNAGRVYVGSRGSNTSSNPIGVVYGFGVR